MGVIHIENVDDKTMAAIRFNADANGRSFEDEVKAVLAQQTKVVERRAEAAAIRAMTKGWSPETDSVAIIREMRDRDG